MFVRKDFEADKRKNAEAQSHDQALREVARDFIIRSDKYGYGYQWTWLGLPVIQMPPYPALGSSLNTPFCSRVWAS